jgi:hypothetical protein
MPMAEMTYKRQILPFWMTQGSDYFSGAGDR